MSEVHTKVAEVTADVVAIVQGDMKATGKRAALSVFKLDQGRGEHSVSVVIAAIQPEAPVSVGFVLDLSGSLELAGAIADGLGLEGGDTPPAPALIPPPPPAPELSPTPAPAPAPTLRCEDLLARVRRGARWKLAGATGVRVEVAGKNGAGAQADLADLDQESLRAYLTHLEPSGVRRLVERIFGY